MNRVNCSTFEDMIVKLSFHLQFYINLDFDSLLSVQVCVVEEGDWNNVNKFGDQNSSGQLPAEEVIIDNLTGEKAITVDDSLIGGPTETIIYRQIIGTFPSFALPGYSLARWCTDEGLYYPRPNRATIQCFRNAYKGGNGNQKLAPHVGTSSYFGCRGSSMSSCTPVEGPGNANKSQYF